MFPRDQRIAVLEERLDSVESKLDRVLNLLEAQQPAQQRLDRHISFIETVYSRVRGSIGWFSRQKSLPEPESSDRLDRVLDHPTEESSA